MSRKVKRVLFAISLLLAFVWNCLCLIGLIPHSKWPFSLTFPSAASLIMLVPLLFPSLSKSDQKLYTSPGAPKQEKVFAGATIGLFAAWVITVIACLVYPL